MRKILLSLFVILCVDICYSQTSDTGIKSNHSISLSTFGAEYGYEQHLKDNWSLIGRLGVTSNTIELISTAYQLKMAIHLTPSVSLEPRLYTSIKRRQALNRNTDNNSSDFVSIKINCMPFADQYSLIPLYGMRRSESKHWFHELSFGPCWIIGKGLTPYCNFRVGYLF